MDVLTNRLERLKQQRFEQRIGVIGNDLDILKNEIRFDLLVCGGSLDIVVSLLYWLMASNAVPPLTVIFTGFLLLTLYNFHSSENRLAGAHNIEESHLCSRIRESLQVYLQLLVWPKIFFHWYFSIREQHSSFFYIVSGGFFLWLYQVGNSISGSMAIYLLLLAFVTFPMIGITVCFEWMLSLSKKETSAPSEESLLPDHTEENEKLWELSVADEGEEKNIIEEFQPSLSELELGTELKNDEEESIGAAIGLELQLTNTCLPDVDDSDSSSSSFEVQNMNFSVHHFSSSGSDDTTDNITSKLEDASRETENIPASRDPSSKSKWTQRGGRHSDEEEGLDVESFEVISREEFNL